MFILMTSYGVFTHTSHAQDCSSPTAQSDLDINNVSARMLNGGDMWWDLSSGKYIVPKPEPGEPEISALFAGSLWIGGYDAADNLRLAAQTYRQSGNDYWSGPIGQDGTADAESCQNWDRHWTVYGADIAAHRADYEDNFEIDNPIPNSILGWPGRENQFSESINGFALPANEDLAPFVDVNFDGLYDPTDGDYPDIKDSDQGIWWMYNDVGNLHTETGADQIGMQVSVLAYAYAGAPGTAINNTTFYEYWLYNKATATLSDTYIGLFVDVDLGCWTNDYVGCDIDRNMGYVYNAEATDPDCDGVPGYGAEIPMLGVRMIEGPVNDFGDDMTMSSFVAFNNNLDQSTDPATTNPEEPQDFYNYMSGSWKDDTRVQYGGDGYEEGTNPTSFMYPSNPSDTSPDSWSECNSGNSPADRRFVMSVGPFNMYPGYQGNITYAVVWVPDVEHPCPDISTLQEAADEVVDFTTTAQYPTSTDFLVELAPHPMKDKTLLTVSSDEIVKYIRIYSADGRLQRHYEKPDNQIIIERDNLSAGIYFYEIKLKNEQLKGGKLVVSN